MRLLSIIVPLYNEEGNVRNLFEELTSVIDGASLRAEFVFVDDGSSDNTVENLVQVANGDERVKIIKFRRNFGQTAAMAAGFDFAEGDVVITLDGDLQNDPREIPRMLEKLDEGFDLVAGWRRNRKDAAISRKLPSLIANRIISRTTKVQLHDYGCTLKAIRADVAKNLHLYGEMHRFIPALAALQGVSIAELPVNHRPRVSGTSKYGISRTFRVMLDLLTVNFFLGYGTRPLHLFGMLGLASGGFGAALMSWLLVDRIFFDVALGGRPLLPLAVMFVLIGMQFICFGLLAEILVRTYHESQDKKTYSVREVITLGAGRGWDEEMERRRGIKRRAV